jgi:alkenylglycerophosphocholine/alkenylglycerophosphoethanolamine hydrolase
VELPLALLIFGALALIGLLTADGRWRFLFLFAKPATTLSLLLITGMPSQDRFGVLVVGALLLSVLGDTALLYDSTGFFLAGLLLFLLAHAAFASAFLLGGGRGPLDPTGLTGLFVMAISSAWLLRRLWGKIGPGLRAPVLMYGVAITAMVGAAYVLLGGPWPFYITVPITAGAVSFYLSDAMLAWGRFRHPLPMQQTVNLAFYWTGQLGIALGARWVAGG